MQLNNVIPLIDKLARREQSPEEMETIRVFLQQAKREDAEAVLEHYYGAINGINTNSDTKALAYRLEQLITDKKVTPVHRVHFLKTAWFKYAAAIIILITGIAIYFSFHTPNPETAVVQNVPPASGSDVAPGFNRAVLTLSNGQQVVLDSAASETINDGTLAIENNNGQLVYAEIPRRAERGTPFSKGGGSSSLVYNTMATPKGGQYKLTLADGTKVWLNAASSITYPTAFAGNTREVKITGEAYFEVAKNAKQPFIVKTNKEEVTVLGTSFNVNSYENEQFKTSLLEGSIKIENNILKPGQAFTNGRVITTSTAQDIAWKNGLFNFNGADLPAVLRQLQRWYDIEVKYEGQIKQREFSGELHRDLTLSQVTNILKEMDVQFRLEGRTLSVK